MMHKVFVFGSLKSEGWNNPVLGGAVKLDDAVTVDKFCMWNMGFPYMFREPAYEGHYQLPVKGEVYEVDDHTLDDLDSLEGHPHFYERQRVEVTLSSGDLEEVWMYINHQEELTTPRLETLEENNKLAEGGTWEWVA